MLKFARFRNFEWSFVYVFPYFCRGDSSWSEHDGDEAVGGQIGTAGERQTYAGKRLLLETKAVFNRQSI